MAPFLDSNFYYGTTSTAALFAGAAGPDYTVNGSDPATVADFAGVKNSGAEYYRTAGSETTFSDMFSYSDTGSLGVMTDSDGALKWKPHTLHGGASYPSITFASSHIDAAFTNPQGGATSVLVTSTSDGLSNHGWTGVSFLSSSVTHVVWLARSNVDYVHVFGTGANGFSVDVNVLNGTLSNQSFTGGASGSMSISTSGSWHKVVITRTEAGATSDVTFLMRPDRTAGTAGAGALTGDAYYCFGAHTFRNDLGGMVDNWDQESGFETLVEATSSARFLARRNHYRYNGASYSKKGILLESAAATQLCAVNRDLFGTGWTGAATGSQNATGIDGVSNKASTITGSFANVRTYDATIGNDGNYYTASFFVKKEASVTAYPGATFLLTGGTSQRHDITIDPINGAVTDRTGGSFADGVARIEDWSATFWRVQLTVQNNSSGNTTGRLQILPAASTDYNGSWETSGPQSIVIDMVQIEQASVASSPIPADINATVTRAAETLTIAGSDMAASTTAMSFHMQGELSTANDNSERLWQWALDGSNRLFTYNFSATTNVVFYQQTAGTTDTVTLNGVMSAASGLNLSFNAASRHTSGAVNGAFNGTAGTADTTPTALADLSSSTFYVGSSNGSANAHEAITIALFRQDDSDWTDTGIEEATS